MAYRPGWSTAVPDWEDRIRDGRSLIPDDLPLFEDQRAKAIRIFDRLRIPDVHGQPLNRDAMRDWLRELVGVLFGSYDPETRVRLIQELFLLVPKKNSKSSGAAAIMMVAMIMNERPQAEALLIAPTKQIANISFSQAAGIIRADDELKKKFHIQEHTRTIKDRVTSATLQIKAADTDAITGGKATYTLIDETHEFAKKSNAAAVFVEVRGALAARPDGFLIQITTQSKEPPAGVFKQELALARDIRDGKIELNPARLAVLYELPEDIREDWRNEATWRLVNPNLGQSVSIDFLRNELTVAERSGAEALALLASQHFNVEIGLALRNDAWPGVKHWLAATVPELASLEELLRRSEVAVVGVDGGGLDDLLGLAVLGRCKETQKWLHWGHAWAHPDVLERRKEIAQTLEDFERAGELTICQEPTQDVEGVADIVEMVRDAELLPDQHAIGVDAAGITAIVDELTHRGFTTEGEKAQIVAVQQGWRLNSAVAGVPRKLKDGTFKHGGQALMAWSVGNAKAETRGNNVYVTKQTAGKAKIDPVIALFNAAMLMSRNPTAANAYNVMAMIG